MGINEQITLLITAQNEASAKLDEVVKSLDKVKTQSTKTTNSMINEFKSLLPAIGAVAIVKALSDMSKAQMDYGESVDDVMNITGASAKQASEWVVQANHVGITAQTIGTAMAILSRNMLNNAQSIEQFGIKTKNADGSLRDINDVLAQTRNKVKEMGAGAKTTALEMALFGRSGKELHEFLSADASEMENVINQAKELGLILDEEMVDSIEKTTRSTNDMKLAQMALGAELNKTIMPALKEISKLALLVAKGFSLVASWSEKIGKYTGRFIGNMGAAEEEIILYHNLLINGTITQEQYNDAMQRMVKQTTDLIPLTENLNTKEKEHTKTVEKKSYAIKDIQKAQQEFQTKYKKMLEEETTATIEALNKQKQKYLQQGNDKLEVERWYSSEVSRIKAEDYNNSLKLAKDDVAAILNIYSNALSTLKENSKEYKAMKQAEAEYIKSLHEKSATDFVSAMKGGYDILGLVSDKFANNIGKSLSESFIGLEVPLSAVGLSVGGIFGSVAGTVVSGFLSLFGNQKSYAEIVEERFQQMANNANKAISEIGKEKGLAQKKLEILDILKIGVGGVYGQGIAESELGIAGLTEAKARQKLLEDLLATQQKELDLRKKSIPTLENEISVMQEEQKNLEKARISGTGAFYRGIWHTTEQIKMFGDMFSTSIQADVDARRKMIDEYDKISELDILRQVLETQKALNIPQFALGGIVNTPTLAMVGEKEPEAIIPLSKMGNMGRGSIIIEPGAFVINGVNWSNEDQKKNVAKDIATYITNYVNGNMRLATGTLRRF
jgi:hypothetical protein